MNEFNFSRISDNSYYFEGGGKKVIIETPLIISSKEFDNPQFKYAIAQEIIKNLPPQFSDEPYSVRCGNITWKVTPQQKEGLPTAIKLFLGTFAHDQGSDDIVRIKIEEHPSGAANMGITVKVHENDTVELTQFRQSLDCRSDPLSDPFTKIAATAFQHYESNFTAKDKVKLHDSDYVIILDVDKNEIQLKDKKELQGGKFEEQKNLATLHYHAFLLAEYGAEKIQYVEHLYGIDFQKMLAEGLPLTPEHVYRMNIGVNNIEIQDLNGLFQKLQTIPDLTANENKNAPLAPFLETLRASFTGRELRGLLREIETQVSPRTATINDLLRWVDITTGGNKEMSDISPEGFTRLHSILQVPERLEEKIFTGKQMYEQTGSGYTTAEKHEYKPWIDQQELLQTLPLFRGNNDWALFNEKCVFTIVKCHLVKEHPTEGYRVGAIIPAPATETGEARWYEVSSCINNGYGIFSYTLESPCNDPSLPSIKLYRSTASDPYALDSEASVRNDLNPLNSPGYEGASLVDADEAPFFEAHSIPIWVAYLEEAKTELSLPSSAEKVQSAFDNLVAATDSITKISEAPFQKQTLRELMRSHDFLLNDLLLESTAAGVALANGDLLGAAARKLETVLGFKPENAQLEYHDLFYELKKEYIDSESYPDLKKEAKDAERLLLLLQDVKRLRNDDKYTSRINELTKQINANIIHPDLKSEEHSLPPILSTLSGFEKKARQLQQTNQTEELSICLNEWSNALNSYALSTNEHISQKKQNDLSIMGHSLGGACTQAQFVHHLISRDRVIVPGKKCNVIFYDAPQINKDDNIAYKKFITDHERIIKNQNINFHIQNNQEAGDFFSLGGEEHLGSTLSPQERDRLDPLQNYEGILRERISTTTDSALSQAKTAHETQFAQGKESKDYKYVVFDSYAQGRIDTVGDQGDKGKLYQEMADKLWKIPQPLNLGLVNSQMAGSLSRSEMLHPLRVYLKQRMEHSRDVSHRNENGVLVVRSKS